PEFARGAGAAAEGATATYFFDTEKKDPAWAAFRQAFEKRYGSQPDVYAGYGYDAAQLFIHAIRKAGPNKYRVHDQLSSLDEYQGVTGYMRFDGRWDNIAPVITAQCKNGKWQFESNTPQTVSLMQK